MKMMKKRYQELRMNKTHRKLATVTILFLVICGYTLLWSEVAMAQDKVLYKVSLIDDKSRTVVVKQSGKKITVSLEGAGDTVTFDANGGGTSTCRTIIEHNSAEATILLSLAIPDPRAACRMLPSYVSIESRTHNISLDEQTVKRVTGSNAQLRSIVQKLFGKIEQEG